MNLHYLIYLCEIAEAGGDNYGLDAIRIQGFDLGYNRQYFLFPISIIIIVYCNWGEQEDKEPLSVT